MNSLPACKTIAELAFVEETSAAVRVRELDELDYREVLALLTEYPFQGVHLESLITDHGLTSPALRGRFYGYFEHDKLVGIALIGHQIMFCAPDEAIPALAHTATTAGVRTSVIFGPQHQVELFWQHYATPGQELKMQRDFYWYVCEKPAQPFASSNSYRPRQNIWKP